MDSHAEISEFLTSRRARLTPEAAGLPDFGGRRRVPGLRREEVALLAGMSSEYYKRLERGNAAGVSESVLQGISRALQLTEAEHEHLLDLVRAANSIAHPMQRRPAPRTSRVRSSVQQMVDAMSTVPVYVQNGRLDCVLTNRLGRAVFSEMFVDQRSPMNAARFGFLDSRAETFYRDLADSRRQSVALLRREAGRDPSDRRLTALIGELSTRSETFRGIWSAHDVKEHRTGVKRLHHPVVGDLDLSFESMDLASERGLQMIVFSAAPGSASHDALTLLGSWAGESDPVGLADTAAGSSRAAL
ncbi:helix-turn-helix transcriptional regulator [Rathayibacter sp. SD072]|uniref:helix-turn-helix transcriptional regulator n=1 Tax=Rathayibacter sp. SD072 TaxID=2781731 RepID=UPI001A9588E4|nr:helix-turn-helix transcriptional regulator [Rathayibacter sp. SD072]MBO0985316.1 helix-turn-helix domain-containing protein [Rathayibacter sp. SD072]